MNNTFVLSRIAFKWHQVFQLLLENKRPHTNVELVLDYILEGTESDPTDLDWTGLQLVGVSEAAEILEVSKQRVNQLTHTAAFPAPIAQLAATKVWHRSDVEAFAEQRKTR